MLSKKLTDLKYNSTNQTDEISKDNATNKNSMQKFEPLFYPPNHKYTIYRLFWRDERVETILIESQLLIYNLMKFFLTWNILLKSPKAPN